MKYYSFTDYFALYFQLLCGIFLARKTRHLILMNNDNKLIITQDAIQESGLALTSAIVWIPYMLISRRPQATFIQ